MIKLQRKSSAISTNLANKSLWAKWTSASFRRLEDQFYNILFTHLAQYANQFTTEDRDRFVSSIKVNIDSLSGTVSFTGSSKDITPTLVDVFAKVWSDSIEQLRKENPDLVKKILDRIAQDKEII